MTNTAPKHKPSRPNEPTNWDHIACSILVAVLNTDHKPISESFSPQGTDVSAPPSTSDGPLSAGPGFEAPLRITGRKSTRLAAVSINSLGFRV